MNSSQLGRLLDPEIHLESVDVATCFSLKCAWHRSRNHLRQRRGCRTLVVDVSTVIGGYLVKTRIVDIPGPSDLSLTVRDRKARDGATKIVEGNVPCEGFAGGYRCGD